MQFQIEELSPTEKRIQISVPASRVESGFARAFKEIASQVSAKGFRRGKIPMSYLQKRYGERAYVAASEALLQEGWERAIQEFQLRPASTPELKAPFLHRGKDYAFEVQVETFPEITLLPASDFEGTVIEWVASDEVVEHELTHLQENYATFEEIGDRDEAQAGDQVIIDFVGSIDGVPFEGGAGEDVPLVLGDKRFIPGFEEGILGQKRGESFDLPLSFPEDYGAEELAGKEANFNITIKKISERRLPEIGEELAGKAGQENLEALKASVKARLEQEHGRTTAAELKRSLQTQIREKYDFVLPTKLIAEILERELKQLRDQLAGQGESGEALEEAVQAQTEEKRAQVEGDIRLELVLNAIAEAQNVRVTESELKSALNERLLPIINQLGWERAQEIIQWQQQPAQLRTLQGQIRQDKALDALIAQASFAVEQKDVPPHVHDHDHDHAHDEAPAED